MDITIKSEALIGLLDRAIRATDYAEGRLMTIDAIQSREIPTNDDVIDPVRVSNRELRLIRVAVEAVQKGEFTSLMGINR